MTLLENIQWGTSPTITGSISYEKQRSGADMQYRVQIKIDAVTGVRYFGYPIYSQVSLDGLQKDSHTIKDAYPSQWSSAYTYTTPWLTLASKTSGTASLKVRIYSGMGTTRDISYTYDLPTDPAASVVSVTSGTMGQNVTISLTRYNTSFTHTIKYSFGALSGTIATGFAANTLTWQIPLTFANQVPNATSGTGTITVTTYNGSTVMGSTQATFTASVPSSVVPTISSVTISEATEGIQAQFSGYVQEKSKLHVVTASAGAYNSTITAVEVTVDGTKYTGANITTNEIMKSGTVTVSVVVTDSRGRTATSSQNVTVIAYSRPSISTFTAYRADEDGNADDEGAYLGFTVNYAISPVNNHNTKAVNIQYKKPDASAWNTAVQYTDYLKNITSVSASAVIDVDYSYQVRVTATDYFETVTRELGDEIATSGDVFDIYRTGKGFAFGKAAESEILEVSEDWPVLINNYASPTFDNVPTPYGGRCTIAEGGYSVRGKRVDVYLLINVPNAIQASETYVWMLYGMPVPLFGSAALHISKLNQDGLANGSYNCCIGESGEICIHFGQNGITANNKLVINGSYWID